MVLRCLPNHLFTRDTSCWVYDGVSINSMRKTARQRETINYEAIYCWHPRFADVPFSRWSGGMGDGLAVIEAGDIEVIGNGAVVAGLSERTSAAGSERLARALLWDSDQVDTVVGSVMKRERAQMHLDTVMTMVNPDTFLKYKKLGLLPSVTTPEENHAAERGSGTTPVTFSPLSRTSSTPTTATPRRTPTLGLKGSESSRFPVPSSVAVGAAHGA